MRKSLRHSDSDLSSSSASESAPRSNNSADSSSYESDAAQDEAGPAIWHFVVCSRSADEILVSSKVLVSGDDVSPPISADQSPTGFIVLLPSVRVDSESFHHHSIAPLKRLVKDISGGDARVWELRRVSEDVDSDGIMHILSLVELRSKPCEGWRWMSTDQLGSQILNLPRSFAPALAECLAEYRVGQAAAAPGRGAPGIAGGERTGPPPWARFGWAEAREREISLLLASLHHSAFGFEQLECDDLAARIIVKAWPRAAGTLSATHPSDGASYRRGTLLSREGILEEESTRRRASSMDTFDASRSFNGYAQPIMDPPSALPTAGRVIGGRSSVPEQPTSEASLARTFVFLEARLSVAPHFGELLEKISGLFSEPSPVLPFFARDTPSSCLLSESSVWHPHALLAMHEVSPIAWSSAIAALARAQIASRNHIVEWMIEHDFPDRSPATLAEEFDNLVNGNKV